MVIGWQENMAEDEVPPRWMWPFPDELEVWFEEVDRKRKEKYGNSSDDGGSESMMENEFARGRR